MREPHASSRIAPCGRMPGASVNAPGNASRRLDQHATTHFHVQSMAEPAAVVPIHPGLVGGEGNRRGLLRADLHAHTMVDHDEAVGYVLDLVNVGDDHGDFVALLDGELVDTEGRCHRHHVHPDLVAVADDLAVAGQVDAIG